MKQNTLVTLFILAIVLVLVGYLLKVKPRDFKYVAEPIVTPTVLPNPQPTPYKMYYECLEGDKCS